MVRTLLEIIGWTGSFLVVYSLMQARVLRFRWLNLAGAIIATVYNAVIGIWPFAAMNGAIAVIDVYWLWRLYREAHDEAVYAVVKVSPDDAYLQHVLHTWADDIERFRPGFRSLPAADDGGADDGPRSAYLVQRGDETVGVVVVRDAGGGEAVVDLDWVTPRFRDFTPGEFVHRRSEIFASFSRVVVPTPDKADHEYLRRMEFRPDGDRWVRELAPA